MRLRDQKAAASLCTALPPRIPLPGPAAKAVASCLPACLLYAQLRTTLFRSTAPRHRESQTNERQLPERDGGGTKKGCNFRPPHAEIMPPESLQPRPPLPEASCLTSHAVFFFVSMVQYIPLWNASPFVSNPEERAEPPVEHEPSSFFLRKDMFAVPPFQKETASGLFNTSPLPFDRFDGILDSC